MSAPFPTDRAELRRRWEQNQRALAAEAAESRVPEETHFLSEEEREELTRELKDLRLTAGRVLRNVERNHVASWERVRLIGSAQRANNLLCLRRERWEQARWQAVVDAPPDLSDEAFEHYVNVYLPRVDAYLGNLRNLGNPVTS